MCEFIEMWTWGFASMYYADLLSCLLIRATVMAQALVLRQKLLPSSWAPDPYVLLVRLPPLALT